ncbi:MAG: hypothetical protein MZW92_16785 [Comamonadaceae bacterium]|nr:hypothetical protein [Comamonadaceae bacterium]
MKIRLGASIRRSKHDQRQATPQPFPFTPILPDDPQQEVLWGGLHGCCDSLALAEAARIDQRLYVVVTTDTQTTLRLEHELRFFLGASLPVLQFPDWETLPYDVFSPLPEIVSQRLKILSLIARIERGILVVAAATLMQRLAPRAHILASTFALKRGDRLRIEDTRHQLESVGYQSVSQVIQHGEFATGGQSLISSPWAANPLSCRVI